MDNLLCLLDELRPPAEVPSLVRGAHHLDDRCQEGRRRRRRGRRSLHGEESQRCGSTQQIAAGLSPGDQPGAQHTSGSHIPVS